MWIQFVEDELEGTADVLDEGPQQAAAIKTGHRQVLGCRWLQVLGGGNSERGGRELPLTAASDLP